MGLIDRAWKKGIEKGKEFAIAADIGLDAEKQYRRAYQEGVFKNNYGSAAKDFDKASRKFQSKKNETMALRSQANSVLYKLLDLKDRSNINNVITMLELVPEIEEIGTDSILVKTGPLLTELKASLLEYQAELASSTSEKIHFYAQAGDLLMPLGTETLSVMDKLDVTGPIDKAIRRAYYYGALSNYYNALTEAMISPAQAHDLFQESLNKFIHAGVSDWSSEVESCIDHIKQKRQCWICGRKMQGLDTHFRYYPASTGQYYKNLVEASGHDISMLDTEGSVTLCNVCGSAIEKQADLYALRRAKEVRDWVEPILTNYEERLWDIEKRQNVIERRQNAIDEEQSNLEDEQRKIKDEAQKTHYVTHYGNSGFKTGESRVDGDGNAKHYDNSGKQTGSSMVRKY